MSNVIPIDKTVKKSYSIKLKKPTPDELILDGMLLMDEAMSRFMDIDDPTCKVITQMLNSALVLGEENLRGNIHG